MSYIIVWNPNSRDSFLHTDTRGFIEEFSLYEEAKEEAEMNVDSDHFRNYIIYEEAKS